MVNHSNALFTNDSKYEIKLTFISGIPANVVTQITEVCLMSISL